MQWGVFRFMRFMGSQKQIVKGVLDLKKNKSWGPPSPEHVACSGELWGAQARGPVVIRVLTHVRQHHGHSGHSAAPFQKKDARG